MTKQHQTSYLFSSGLRVVINEEDDEYDSLEVNPSQERVDGLNMEDNSK